MNPRGQHSNNQPTVKSKSHQTQFNNRQYDRIRVLGKGSFGTAIVYRRRADLSLIVLKEIELDRFKDEREKSTALDEALIMSKLNHVNIIKYHNAYLTDKKLIIEMEYAGLGTLESYVLMLDHQLEEQEILIIFRQILSGLHYLHSKKVVHLDLKMTNIFVTVEGQVKIGDFGIAQFMGNNLADSQDQEQTVHRQKIVQSRHDGFSQHLGTLAYSSPERCLGQETDSKSDIWSIGCILYELITSKTLFSGESLPELLFNITQVKYQPIEKRVNSSIIEMFERMIAAEPKRRPSAYELLCLTNDLLTRIQMMKNQTSNPKRATRRNETSNDNNLFSYDKFKADDQKQLNYPHSLVYQVKLNSANIQVDRVNLPLSKRIKEISKGKSHYLVLTYDNIVYGWGSKTHGQLGSCGLTHISQGTTSISKSRFSRSARNSVNLRERRRHKSKSSHQKIAISSTTPNSLASSTQTIQDSPLLVNSNTNISAIDTNVASPYMTRQLVLSMLAESQAASRPFIINELNHRKIIQVAAGKNFSVFLTKTGIVMTCGDASLGCLGRGESTGVCFTPCMVDSLLNMDVSSISCGPKHVVAVCANGQAFSWGYVGHGRLGTKLEDPSSKLVLKPKLVALHPDIRIKRAFCGDRCTIFIDSNGTCWACGENRFNKLGLDVVKRFKAAEIVESSWLPVQIPQLKKYQIVSISIGKNHTSLLTSEGKLIVLGRDIDYTYKLERNLFMPRGSHSRLSFELRNKFSSQIPLVRTGSFLKSNISDLVNSTKIKVLPFNSVESSSRRKFSRDNNMKGTYKLSIFQKKQISQYMKKTRSSTKMTFDSVIKVANSNNFTVVLTSDNRVYFWGTRSHTKDYTCTSAQATKIEPESISPLVGLTTEPQLVAKSQDECFIKIGETNTTLMNTILKIGSDQPIIHAQDPRLIAKTLDDIWILDYQTQSVDDISSPDSCSSIDCSRCSCYSCSDKNYESDTCSSSSQSFIDGVHPLAEIRHDAILEPQPIVSLYVPSMFNNSGCSLHVADLFCFDNDKFYLVLDTNIKLLNSQLSRQSSTITSPPQRNVDSINLPRTRTNSMAAEGQDIKNQNSPVEMAPAECSSHPQTDGQALNSKETSGISNNLRRIIGLNHKSNSTNRSQSDDLDTVVEKATSYYDDNNNDASLNYEVSLEEPRSFSTFATASLGNHIVVAPSMKRRQTIEQDQTLYPLNFESPSSSPPTVLKEHNNDSSPDMTKNFLKSKSRCMRSRVKRSLVNKSESTATFIVDAETSSMPSWVKNEFIEYQINDKSDQPESQASESASGETLISSHNSSVKSVESIVSEVENKTHSETDGFKFDLEERVEDDRELSIKISNDSLTDIASMAELISDPSKSQMKGPESVHEANTSDSTNRNQHLFSSTRSLRSLVTCVPEDSRSMTQFSTSQPNISKGLGNSIELIERDPNNRSNCKIFKSNYLTPDEINTNLLDCQVYKDHRQYQSSSSLSAISSNSATITQINTKATQEPTDDRNGRFVSSYPSISANSSFVSGVAKAQEKPNRIHFNFPRIKSTSSSSISSIRKSLARIFC